MKQRKEKRLRRVQRLRRPSTLVVGLGNPGKAYEKTRHNAGFLLCESLKAYLGCPGFQEERRFFGEYSDCTYRGEALCLFRPLTYMNKSGEAVAPIVQYLEVPLESLLVCHDDLDLPLGKVRFQAGGGSGGHRGVESIVRHLGTNQFPRLRLGIGRPGQGCDVKDYVLGPFPAPELHHFEKVLQVAKDGVLCFVEKGIQHAMNDFNGRTIAP